MENYWAKERSKIIKSWEYANHKLEILPSYTMGIMCFDKSLQLNISLFFGTKSAGKISAENKDESCDFEEKYDSKYIQAAGRIPEKIFKTSKWRLLPTGNVLIEIWAQKEMEERLGDSR